MITRPQLYRRLGCRQIAPLMAAAVSAAFCCALLLTDPQKFWCDDYQVYHLAGYFDTARAIESGELPLLSPYSWYGGALAAEYQNGTFSIFIAAVSLLIWKLDLSLPTSGALFSLIHLMVLAAGVFQLARQRRLAPEHALFAALIASLNGFMINWAATAWTPAVATFAWVPWTWWALERALQRTSGLARFLPAGFFIYLNLTAGWPFPVLMNALVTAFVMARAFTETGRVQRLWPAVAAWAWGLALAAPALLMLIEYFAHSARNLQSGGLMWALAVPPKALIGLVFPHFTTEWLMFKGVLHPRPAVELACGLIPPVLVGAAIYRLRHRFLKDQRWELAMLGGTLLLALLPSVAPFGNSFRWLMLFFLVLGLISARALAELQARSPGHNETSHWLTSNRIISFGLAIRWLEVIVIMSASSLLEQAVFGTSSLVALMTPPLIYLVYRLLRRSHLATRWLPTVSMLTILWITYTFVPMGFLRWDFPESIREHAPLEPEVLYYSAYSRYDAYRSDPELANLIRPGNTSLYAGIRMVNGYSPIRPDGLSQVLGMSSNLGFSSDQSASRVLEFETGPDGLLALMGVDGLILAGRWSQYRESLLDNGWNQVHVSNSGVVLHRDGPPSPAVRSSSRAELVSSTDRIPPRILEHTSGPVPLLLARSRPRNSSTSIEYARRKLELVRETRSRVEVLIRGQADRASLISMSRPWYPGYRATFNGVPIPVEALNLIVPAVEIPPGPGGLLVLEYRPQTLVIGAIVSGLACLVGVTLLVGRSMFSGTTVSRTEGTSSRVSSR